MCGGIQSARDKCRIAGCLAALLVLLLLGGCAHGLKEEARSKVDFNGTVADVQGSPETYLGRVARWGGTIIKTRVLPERTDVFVLQHPLDYSDRPKVSGTYMGRFIVRVHDFLDPAVFQKGRPVSVVGTIRTTWVSHIGGAKYVYPVVEPMDMRLWNFPGPISGPLFHLGLGVSGRF